MYLQQNLVLNNISCVKNSVGAEISERIKRTKYFQQTCIRKNFMLEKMMDY